MKRLFVLLFIVFGCLFINPAYAAKDETNSFSIAYFKDASGQASFNEVETSATFTPFEGILSKGYDTKAVYWLKVLIPPGKPGTQPWILRLQPSWHDNIRLYDPREQGSHFRQTGDHFPWSLSEFPSLSHAFVLEKTNTPRDVYIRIQSVHSYQINVELLSQIEAERAEWHRMLLLSLYLSVMTLVWFWAIINFWSTRDPLLGYFVTTQLTAILYSLLAFGVARTLLDEFITDSILDKVHSAIIIFYTFAAMQFNKLLLENAGMKRWISIPVNLISFLPIVSLCLYLFGHITNALSINSICLMSFPIATIIAVWAGIEKSKTDRSIFPLWILRLYFTLSLFIGLLGALPLLNIMKATNISSQIFLFHGPLLITLIGIFLVFRSRNLLREQKRSLAIANTVADQEKKKRVEQSRFMTMLNHEIKIPLGILKLLVAGQSIQSKAERQIDTIVALLERCLLDDQLRDQNRKLKNTLFDPADIVRKLIQNFNSPERFLFNLESSACLKSDQEICEILASNILDNAVKYSPEGSTIEVSLKDISIDEKMYICLRIKNQIGRAGAPDPNRVFEKYYRAEAARSLPGTGLGLYLVQSFAISLGGHVSYHSSSHEVEFSLCIPH